MPNRRDGVWNKRNKRGRRGEGGGRGLENIPFKHSITSAK